MNSGNPTDFTGKPSAMTGVEAITRKQAVQGYTGYTCIGLYNPKGPENVGSIMRAAGCFGVNTVFYTGTRYERASAFRTDTKQVHLQLPLTGYQHPERAFYIFGPEDGSLKKNVTSRCRDIVYIPTHGCMNLAATVNVVLYDRMLKAGGVTARQVDSCIDSHRALRICADLANGSKHCKLTRYLRTDGQPHIAGKERQTSTWLSGNGGGEVMRCKYTIVSNSDLFDALALAKECVLLWESYINDLQKHAS